MGIFGSSSGFNFGKTGIGKVFGGGAYTGKLEGAARGGEAAATSGAAAGAVPWEEGGYGRPVQQDYVDPTNADGSLKSVFSVKAPTGFDQLRAGNPLSTARLDAIHADPRGMNALRQEALRKGPSSWANTMDARSNLEESGAVDNVRSSAQGAAMQAQNNLAMRGGLGGGAAERIAESGNEAAMKDAQAAHRAGQVDRLGVAVQDESNRQTQLAALPGQEVAWMAPELDKAKTDLDTQRFNTLNQQDVDKYNIGNTYDAQKTNVANTMGANTNKNLWNTGRYASDMAGYGAGQSADATARSAKK